jgi:glycerol-3-phosphate dehydrogenase
MALTVADVLIRRTTLAFELGDNGRALAPAVAQLMAKELGWNTGRETAELVRYGREAGRIFRVD